MTKSLNDVSNHVREARLFNRTDELGKAISADIRKRMGELLSERELIGIDYLNTFVYDKDTCGSHEYLDANMPVLDAVADYCERVVGLDRETFYSNALVADDSHGNDGLVVSLMQLGWDQVKKDGFSKLWSADGDLDIKKDIAIIALELPSGEHGVRALLEEQKDEDAAFARLTDGGTELHDMATKIKSGGDSDGLDIIAFLETIKASRGIHPSR